MGELGGTGATFIVPIIFILFMKSKQLKAVGKASIVPVMFAVNEPLLFAAPIVLNPYFLIPFCLAPIVNVILGKFFISVLGMNGYMHVLPWATPGPIGNLMSTHFQPISFVFTVLLLVVDFIIYYPFCKAYDKVLLSEETKNANTEDRFETNNSTKVDESETVQLEKEIKILVLCAGAGTSAMLANTLTEGASSLN
ncbi:pts system lactose-specific transporter subunit EIIBC [Streptococcus pneumoniae]|nr:pts system lactose-specific transporter subunit EIIBC [Streptococcus pneumoniae]